MVFIVQLIQCILQKLTFLVSFTCLKVHFLVSEFVEDHVTLTQHRSGDYKMPSVRASVRLSCFCINLNISFIYKYIFTKLAGNVYGYENLSLQDFSIVLKNKMAAIANCLKIIKVL